MATAFDSFDFAGSDRWREIESNLYFTDNNPKEQARILLKRKRKSHNKQHTHACNSMCVRCAAGSLDRSTHRTALLVL